MNTRSPLARPAVFLAVLALSLAPAAAKDEEPNAVQVALGGLTLGDGQAVDQIVIFPLLAPAGDASGPDVKPNVWASNVGYSEPELPKKRYNVGIANNETSPLFVIGGTVLGGGKRDRMVPNDVIVPVGGRVEMRTIVASARKDTRKEAIPFQTSSSLAPPYLRERAEFNPSNTLVPSFVSHFLDFRNEDDKRESLTAISSSDELNVLCLPCHQSLAEFPTAQGGRVVGMVTAVRGRIRILEVFGSNRLFKAYFAHVLKSQTFASAAIAVRAKRVGLEPPGNGDPEKAVAELRVKAQKILDRLKSAKYRGGDQPAGSAGEYAILRTSDGTRGAAVALDGVFLHAAVFPHDPFEHALFSRNLKPPTPDPDESDLGRGRRIGGGISPYESRLLRRLGRTRGR
jgi:hypothetical protein